MVEGYPIIDITPFAPGFAVKLQQPILESVEFKLEMREGGVNSL